EVRLASGEVRAEDVGAAHLGLVREARRTHAVAELVAAHEALALGPAALPHVIEALEREVARARVGGGGGPAQPGPDRPAVPVGDGRAVAHLPGDEAAAPVGENAVHVVHDARADDAAFLGAAPLPLVHQVLEPASVGPGRLLERRA